MICSGKQQVLDPYDEVLLLVEKLEKERQGKEEVKPSKSSVLAKSFII